jgi:cytochrome P450
MNDPSARSITPGQAAPASSSPTGTCKWIGGSGLSVPYTDRADFRRWADDATHIHDPTRSQAGLARLRAYMRDLVEDKRTQPSNDFISELVALALADSGLTLDGIPEFRRW